LPREQTKKEKKKYSPSPNDLTTIKHNAIIIIPLHSHLLLKVPLLKRKPEELGWWCV
jgi:hypothetical protein